MPYRFGMPTFRPSQRLAFSDDGRVVRWLVRATAENWLAREAEPKDAFDFTLKSPFGSPRPTGLEIQDGYPS
jgi:hypothetical protein